MNKPLTKVQADGFLDAVRSRAPVAGLTHDFYRYPARFSPEFARSAIETFSKPGDLILDPFVGGGTTLVEALACGRHAIGSDINSLAQFVSAVKTTTLSARDLGMVADWAATLPEHLNVHRSTDRAWDWAERGYQKDLPWRLRKLLEQMITRIPELERSRQQRFARCLVLRVGQWALDCKKHLPTVDEFRHEILNYLMVFVDGMTDFRDSVFSTRRGAKQTAEVIQCQASDIESFVDVRDRRPQLIVTSPPYPGVYVLYHRWKIRGRRETPAPFWVADCQDGHGQSYYCFGGRKHQELANYFAGIRDSFASIRRIVGRNALVVQVVAFAQPEWQIRRYLQAMNDAGFSEVPPRELGINQRTRISRDVPGRKWFAWLQGDLSSSREIVLFHRPS